jgi:ABC-type branched-subunit amino acid transport system permease subunit
LPLVGAFAVLGFGVIFGVVSTRRAGVVFAMITLGVGALVHFSSLMFTDFSVAKQAYLETVSKSVPFSASITPPVSAPITWW